MFRMTLSDGVSYVSTLVSEKVFNSIPPNDWQKSLEANVIISALAKDIKAQKTGDKK